MTTGNTTVLQLMAHDYRYFLQKLQVITTETTDNTYRNCRYFLQKLQAVSTGTFHVETGQISTDNTYRNYSLLSTETADNTYRNYRQFLQGHFM